MASMRLVAMVLLTSSCLYVETEGYPVGAVDTLITCDMREVCGGTVRTWTETTCGGDTLRAPVHACALSTEQGCICQGACTPGGLCARNEALDAGAD